MKMSNDSRIKLYIDIEKPYYYPGEIVSVSILIHVKEKINCNKMIIIAKGKQFINALASNNFQNDEEIPSYTSSSSSSSDLLINEINDPSEVKIEEKKHIFKLSKETIISKNILLMKENILFLSNLIYLKRFQEHFYI